MNIFNQFNHIQKLPHMFVTLEKVETPSGTKVAGFKIDHGRVVQPPLDKRRRSV